MLHIRLLLACAAMLLSWLCFDSAEVRAEQTVSVHTGTAYISAETALLTEEISEETAEAVMEAVGSDTLYTMMAGRHLDSTPLPEPTETADCEAEIEIAVTGKAEAPADLQMEADICYVRDENAVALHDSYLANRSAAQVMAEHEKMAEQRRAEEARIRALEEQRIREEKEARERRVAEAKAAKEARLRAACPGYDTEFIATLTKEEQAEARYFYEKGYVFYRQNWSSVKDAEYGDCGFGQCGCGPTCIAAVISNLAGIPVDPEEMRVYGLSVGSWLPSGGTTYGFLIETAKKYGISTTQIYASDKESLFEALRDENKLVLATMGPGDFTLGAHFMLFRGITDEGKILIADSYSFEHSIKEWDYEDLYAQLKTGYWIFEKTK